MREFFAWRSPALACPDQGEARAYLAHLIETRGKASAGRDYSWLLIGAAALWGRVATAHLAPILRQERCTPKPLRATEWDRARTSIGSLIPVWQAPFLDHLERSMAGRAIPGREIWSASQISAVARALSAWTRYCASVDQPPRPTGVAFNAYADWLQGSDGGGVSLRTVADYLGRILSGYEVILEPGFQSPGARWVAEDYDQRSRSLGATTKATAGIVPASRLYGLAWDLIDEARTTPYLGLEAARRFRNGLLLAIAVSLPERARALAALDLATTFRLAERPRIEVHLPGTVLKQKERHKRRRPFSATLSSQALWDALDEYRRVYRPQFDAGSSLFPSVHARGAAVSEGRLGQLVGDITERRLGVRVSIHRVRDCVATEASEELVHGGVLAPVLLRHKDERTTRRHYDHAEGLRASQALADFMAKRQRSRPSLRL